MPVTLFCSSCQRELRIPDEYMGKKVKCPACGLMFTAGATEPAALDSAGVPPPLPEAGSVPPVADPTAPVEATLDEEDYYDLPPDRRPRRRRDMKPHRGPLILTFGILSLFCVLGVLGPVAWIMGQADMNEIRAGRMDPEGEGTTNTGRILGIIGTILLIPQCLGCGMWLALGAAMNLR